MLVTLRKLGWIRDRLDPRDHPFEAVRRIHHADIPDEADLTNLQIPVFNQELSDCTANAILGLYGYLDLNDGDKKYTDLSRLYLYFQERAKEHTIHQDSGAMIRDGMMIMVKKGCCPEDKWKYDPKTYEGPVPEGCDQAAAAFKLKSVQRVNTFMDMLAAIADKKPVVFGAALYDSFMSDEVAKTGRVPMPNLATESYAGGHAMLAVGYSRSEKYIKVRNSWGEGWGEKGYGYMPIQYFESLGKMVSDCWTGQK